MILGEPFRGGKYDFKEGRVTQRIGEVAKVFAKEVRTIVPSHNTPILPLTRGVISFAEEDAAPSKRLYYTQKDGGGFRDCGEAQRQGRRQGNPRRSSRVDTYVTLDVRGLCKALRRRVKICKLKEEDISRFIMKNKYKIVPKGELDQEDEIRG